MNKNTLIVYKYEHYVLYVESVEMKKRKLEGRIPPG